MKNNIKLSLLLLLLVGSGSHSANAGIFGWFWGSPQNRTQRRSSSTVLHQKSSHVSFLGKLSLFMSGLLGLHGLNAYGRVISGEQNTLADGSNASLEAYKNTLAPILPGARALKDTIVAMFHSLSEGSQVVAKNMLSGLNSAKDAGVAYGHHAGFSALALLSLLLIYDTCDPAPKPRASVRALLGRPAAIQPPQTEVSLHQKVHRFNKKLRLSSGSVWSLALGVPAAVMCYDMFNMNRCGSLMPTSIQAAGVAAVVALGLSSYSLRELFGTPQNNQRSLLNTIFCKMGNGIECLGSVALAVLVANMLYGSAAEGTKAAS